MKGLVEKGIIEVIFVKSEDNVADGFTKNVSASAYEKFRTDLGLATH